MVITTKRCANYMCIFFNPSNPLCYGVCVLCDDCGAIAETLADWMDGSDFGRFNWPNGLREPAAG